METHTYDGLIGEIISMRSFIGMSVRACCDRMRLYCVSQQKKLVRHKQRKHKVEHN